MRFVAAGTDDGGGRVADVFRIRPLSFAQQEVEPARLFTHFQQGMAHLLAEDLEIPNRFGIGGGDLQHLAAVQPSEGFFGFENWQRTVQPGGIKFGVNRGHGILISRRWVAKFASVGR
ncbi:hypothetical protein BN874_30028 [Candidatus Contendobacter odensis Run_B_J11]|uniref:Uncharacterized protein n=1 Tax=Candidatus Contendobacter odensis Run_B_J11 TaxID=1400861 RepID=A0A7U7GD06_9GAMM|nr:hypothetical protein BN874_30028 [Candidatus Contendobacter odensis Run_B_J11]